MQEDKLDPYNHKNKYLKWKEAAEESGIDGITNNNSKIILRYVFDMETGQNVARGTKKGARSWGRLNKIRTRITFFAKLFESRNKRDITKLSEKDVISLFDDLSKGNIKKEDGNNYTHVADMAKDFKAFWHWLIKIKKKEGIEIEDITSDVSTTTDENSFVYFTKDELEKFMAYFDPDEQVRMLFMFDTIIRSPTELMNIRVSDLAQDLSELSIREETSKTYGRTIKLLLCKDGLKEYIKRKDLKQEDYLFSFSAPMFNQKLHRIAKHYFGERMTKGGQPFSKISMYDFRHSGACHWRLGAYRSKIDALMYRGGWTNLEMLNYYTKKLGMKDSIEKDDLLVGLDKTQLEKQIAELQNQLQEEKNIREKSALQLNELADFIEELRTAKKVKKTKGGFIEAQDDEYITLLNPSSKLFKSNSKT